MRYSRRALAKDALAAASVLALPASTAKAQGRTKISFYYPVQVGGPLTQVVDGYVTRFKAENFGVDVEAVYSGNYIDTTTKSLTAAKSGSPPTVAVLLATDIYT